MNSTMTQTLVIAQKLLKGFLRFCVSVYIILVSITFLRMVMSESFQISQRNEDPDWYRNVLHGAFYYNLSGFWKGDICVGHDNNGANITISVNSTLPYSVECNVGTFTVNTGITATIPASGVFKVYAQNVDIQGTILADGKGYAAQTGPGAATANNGGGSYGGNGSDNLNGAAGVGGYGAIVAPKEKGSGGWSSAGGGSVQMVIKSSFTMAGIISANGTSLGSCTGGAGSGGSVYIRTDSWSGAGTIRANGGRGWGGCGAGGGGRIAMYYNSKTFSGTVTAYGHTANYNSAPGTYFEKVISNPTGTLYVDNGGTVPYVRSPLTGATATIGQITVSGAAIAQLSTANYPSASMEISSATVYATGVNVLNALTVKSAGILTHDVNGTTKTEWIEISMNTLSVESGGIIDANALGYSLGNGPGAATLRAGASHGGYGAVAATGATGAVYGSVTNPNDLGSSGASTRGGGLIRLTVSGTATIDGTIRANSGALTTCGNGPGSGGSIYLNFGTWAGTTGVIQAMGSNDWGGCAPSGGGRIAVYYTNKTYSGSISTRSGTSVSWPTAAAGTIFQKPASGVGQVTVDNTGAQAGGITPLDDVSDTLIEEIVAGTYSKITLTSTNRNNLDLVVNSQGRIHSTNSIVVDDIIINSAGTLVTNTSLTLDNLDVNNGGVYTHDVNTNTKTNWIEFTATNVTVNSGGSISANGSGYSPTNGPGAPTAGYGGGSHGGNGGTAGGGTAHDSIVAPNDMGSGGYAGFYGGGYIKATVSGTVTVDGTISANGLGNTGSCPANNGGGGGGGIYISTSTFAGAGTGVISANGGSNTGSCGSGGGGRVAVYYNSKTYTGALQAFNGTNTTSASRGGAGTVFEKDNAASTGTLRINDNASGTVAYTPITGTYSTIGTISITNTPLPWFENFTGANALLTITASSTSYFKGANTFNTVTVAGTATHATNTTTKVNYIDITATTFSIVSGGTINVDGKGYSALNGPGAGAAGIGGSYGGRGGGAATASPYSSLFLPDDLGSGGNNSAGGGLVKLTVSGTATIDGPISANGGASATACANGSTGSGGAVYISAGTITGTQSISTIGGAATCSGGGGGRIAIYYNTNTYNNSALYAYGGAGSAKGGAGTKYLKDNGQAKGDVYINNQGVVTTAYTIISGISPTTINSYSIENRAIVYSLATNHSGATFLFPNSYGNLYLDGANTINTNISVVDGTLRTMGTGNTLANVDVGLAGVWTIDGPTTAADVTISSGTIDHTANTTAKTYAIDLTAANLTISGSGINVTSKGYSALNGPGAGASGVGGTFGGRGASSTVAPYSSITVPNDLGSGGNNSAGGGLVKLNISGTTTVTGNIVADGGASTAACAAGSTGSGGGIYISTGTITGAGTISANGGAATCANGGGGRIAIYYGASSYSGTTRAYGGNGAGASKGGAGTVFIKDTGQSTGTLTINNNALAGTWTPLTGTEPLIGTITVSGSAKPTFEGVNFANAVVTIPNTYTSRMDGVNIINSFTLSGTLSHSANTTAKTNWIDLTAATMTVSSTGSINLQGLGYTPLNGPGGGTGAIGGSYGGVGGNGGAAAYGSNTNPNDLGSGSGNTSTGTAGGGLVKLRVTGTLTVDGSIIASGANGPTLKATGAGGSIYISAATFAGAGTGSIVAAGGNSTGAFGTGGGGRIAQYYTTKTYSGAAPVAGGGTGSSFLGTAGTVYDAGAGSYPGP